SPANLARIFQHGIVRALYETLTHTPAPFIDHRITTKSSQQIQQLNHIHGDYDDDDEDRISDILGTGIEKVDMNDMSVDHEENPPVFMSEEQTKVFACLILPALIQAYYSTNISTEAKTWEIRAMIID
ncbi:17595_t:CDS:2, partial [Racocetra fulgida]